MLGANRPTAFEHQLEHRVVDPNVVGVRAEHVHVDVAVAQMAEQDRPFTAGRRDDAGDPLEEAAELVQRHADIELVRDPDRVDRLGVALAQRP